MYLQRPVAVQLVKEIWLGCWGSFQPLLVPWASDCHKLATCLAPISWLRDLSLLICASENEKVLAGCELQTCAWF